MKRGPILFLAAVTVLVGLVALSFYAVGFPAALASSKVDHHPLFLGLYLPGIPFFVALYQTLKLLGYIDKNKAFSAASIKALQYIRYCALAVGALFTAGLPYIYYVADKDDAPGVLALGLMIIGVSVTIAVFVAVLQRLFQSAIDMHSRRRS